MADSSFKTYADFQKMNFFRKPNWRWERILHLVSGRSTPLRCSSRDDEYVKKARAFVLLWNSKDTREEREVLFWKDPALFYAYDLFDRSQEQEEVALIIEARLLAGMSPHDIGETMGVMPDAITWYERLFFNVSEYLKHRDWITKQVLLPPLIRLRGNLIDADSVEEDDDNNVILKFKDQTAAKPFLDGSLKLFAYFGGPYLVDVMLAGFQSGKPVTSPDDVSTWVDQQWAMTLKRRSAQAALQFDINKYNATELFMIHTKIIEIERSDETQEKTRSQMERSIQSMLDSIPWPTGQDAEKLLGDRAVGRFDRMASELRDDELIRLSAGDFAPTLADNWPTELPPARPRTKAIDAPKPDL